MNLEDNIFNINDSDLMLETLDFLNSKVNQMNSILKKLYRSNIENGAIENGSNNVIMK